MHDIISATIIFAIFMTTTTLPRIFLSLVLFVWKIQLCRPLQTLSLAQSTLTRVRKSRSFLQMEIPPYKKPRRQNVPGNLYVDESCIDCDVCRWMCPTIYGRKGVKSAVIKQPSTIEDKLHAYAAMIACPVGSIRTVMADPVVKDALHAFPAEVYVFVNNITLE
jgi:ferredoxin